MPANTAHIIIHGNGGTIADALKMIRDFDNFNCYWFDGIFYVPKKIGMVLRKILNEGDEANLFFLALQKIAIAKMLQSCFSPGKPENEDQFTTFQEYRILDEFPDFGIQFMPSSRKESSSRLGKEGRNQLVNLLSINASPKDNTSLNTVIDNLLNKFVNPDRELISEDSAIKILSALDPENKSGIADSIKQLRDMGESGADLDTISSATFYAHALSGMAKYENRNFLYGRDFDFVFVNYHQGLKGISEKCADGGIIYIADIPVSTVPDWRGDLEFLHQKGFIIERYEDHHPYMPEHIEMLEQLQKEGLIKYFAMSGPVQETELPTDKLKCSGDMIYEALIKDKPWDTPAMAFLRKCVHGEDLALEREETGKLLTELIKGGINSIELVQTLLSCNEKNDITSKLQEKGWQKKIEEERQIISRISDRFNEHVQIIKMDKPKILSDKLSGPAMCSGSDMPVQPSLRKKDSENLTIALMLAPKSKKGEPKLKIGRAQEFILKQMPECDYLFFCYGSSIMVTRRLNQADTSLNLSSLMKKLGTQNDGGHSGAAVCTPENNPSFPKKILGNISGANFSQYCRYLSNRISQELNVNIHSRTDISIKKSTESQIKAGKNLIILLISTILIGLLILFINKNFRPVQIIKQNQDFFNWFKAEPENNQNDSEIPSDNTSIPGKDNYAD